MQNPSGLQSLCNLVRSLCKRNQTESNLKKYTKSDYSENEVDIKKTHKELEIEIEHIN